FGEYGPLNNVGTWLTEIVLIAMWLNLLYFSTVSGCRAVAPLGVSLTQSQRYRPPRLREAAAGSLGSPPTTCDTPVPAPRRSARERPFPWTSPCTRSPSACSAMRPSAP